MNEKIQIIRNALKEAPRQGPVPPGLVGWIHPDGTQVCAKCAGRLVARGCGYLLRGARDVWSNDKHAPPFTECHACEAQKVGAGDLT